MRTDTITRPRLAHLGLLLVAGVAGLGVGTTLVSAAPDQKASAPKAGEIYLINRANTKLNFELSNQSKSGAWKPFSLAKGASSTYANYRFIRIATGKGKMTVIKTYDISHSPRRYSLVWNHRHDCWDVFHEQVA
jgi:hypothetical protein